MPIQAVTKAAGRARMQKMQKVHVQCMPFKVYGVCFFGTFPCLGDSEF